MVGGLAERVGMGEVLLMMTPRQHSCSPCWHGLTEALPSFTLQLGKAGTLFAASSRASRSNAAAL